MSLTEFLEGMLIAAAGQAEPKPPALPPKVYFRTGVSWVRARDAALVMLRHFCRLEGQVRLMYWVDSQLTWDGWTVLTVADPDDAQREWKAQWANSTLKAGEEAAALDLAMVCEDLCARARADLAQDAADDNTPLDDLEHR